MNITGAAVVRVPAELSAASVETLMVDLYAAFDASSDVVLFAGASAGTFCAGRTMMSGLVEPYEARAFASVLASLLDSPKPTLAFVDGAAMGEGLGLAAACDWVVATEQATFGLPDLQWGVMPAMIWPIITTRLSEGVARRWTVSGHSRVAAEAEAAGLIDGLIDGDDPGPALDHTIEMLRRADREALRTFRHWIFEMREAPIDTALARGASVTTRMIRTRRPAFADS